MQIKVASMQCFDKSLYMKIKDSFNPKLPKDIRPAQLRSSFLEKRKLPYIELQLVKDGILAKVEFEFFYITRETHKVWVSNRDESYSYDKKFKKNYVTRVITGTSADVYPLAAKIAARISLSLSKQFNEQWQSSLMNLLNKPSKNKSILNLGIYKNTSYGIYDIEEPKTLLARLMSENEIKQKDLASTAGVDEATVWRHLTGKSEITREAAIKYGKALGCDPAKILFNDLKIPMWGSVDTLEMATVNRLSVYASEIIAQNSLGTIECPREIYRPDVKAIRVDSPNSSLHNQVAFYYNSNEPLVFEDQIVIVGTKLKNFTNDIIRERYFIGTYKKNKDGKTVDLYTIDPLAVDISGIEPDEDMHEFEQVVSFAEDQMKVIEGITPTFVAPVVAMVDPLKVYDPIKTEVTKAYDEIYTASRTQEAKAAQVFKNIQMRSLVEDKVNKELAMDSVDDMLDHIHKEKVKALLDADKRLQTVISKGAYGYEKYKEKFDIKNKVKEIKSDLNEKENQIVQSAYDEILEKLDTPTPTDEDYLYRNDN
ncbi:putative lexA-like repressor [uncultured Mediterranean phage uvMED]|nr:putative lexA-like repressor [uncultured Mediterranean phage uvMED]